MKRARTRHSALSFFVSISMAGTVLAASPSLLAADIPPGTCAAPAAETPCVSLAEGDLALAAGLLFGLPRDARPYETPGAGLTAWVDEQAGLFVAAVPQVATGLRGLALGDLVAAATDLAVALGGTVTGFSVYDNAGADVYVYEVDFVHAGTELKASLGFVPLADATLSALVAIWREAETPGVFALVDELYAGVDAA